MEITEIETVEKPKAFVTIEYKIKNIEYSESIFLRQLSFAIFLIISSFFSYFLNIFRISLKFRSDGFQLNSRLIAL